MPTVSKAPLGGAPEGVSSWDGRRSFDVHVISGTLAVRDALRQVMQALKPLSLDPEEISVVELVLAETINNVVEHAYPLADHAGPIDITCNHLADGLHFVIRDAGHAMPDDEVPQGVLKERSDNIQELPEGGFGWFLIKELARDIRYSRRDGENKLEFRVAVSFAKSN